QLASAESRARRRRRRRAGEAARPEAERRRRRGPAPPRQAQARRLAAVTEVVVEASGETVGEAKWAALRELERLHPGLDRAAVRFEVVSEGERGLLGVGYAPARVVAAVEAPEPAAREADTQPVSAGAALARDFVERTLSALGAACGVTVEERDDAVAVVLSGPDVGLVIGRHGQTIDALQYLANAV